MIAFVLMYVVNMDRESISIIPDTSSLGFQGIVLSMLAAVVLSPIAYLRASKYRNELLPEQLQVKYNWIVIPITIAVTLLVALIVGGGFELLTRSFQGMKLSRISASLRLGTIIGVLLSMVGIMRFGIGPISNIIHDLSATGMGVVLGLLLLFMPRFISQLPRILHLLVRCGCNVCCGRCALCVGRVQSDRPGDVHILHVRYLAYYLLSQRCATD